MGDWASGLVICVTGFDKERRRLIKHVVEAGGGEYRGSLNRECTHLVVSEGSDSRTSKKLSAAKQNEAKWKTELTTLEWVLSHGSLRGGLAENESSLANCNVRKDRQPPSKSTSHISPSRKRPRLSRFASRDHYSQGVDMRVPRSGPLGTHPQGMHTPSDPTGQGVDAAPKRLHHGSDGNGIPTGSEGVSQTKSIQHSGQSSDAGHKEAPPSLTARPHQHYAQGPRPWAASVSAQPSHRRGSMPFPPSSWVTRDIQPSIAAIQVPLVTAPSHQTHPEQGHISWPCGGGEPDPPRLITQVHAVPSVTQLPIDSSKPAKAAWQCGVGGVGVPGEAVQPLGHGPSEKKPQPNYIQASAGRGGVLPAIPQVSGPLLPRAKAQATLPTQMTVRAGSREPVMEGPHPGVVSSVSALQFQREGQPPTSTLFQREEGRPGIAKTQEEAMAFAPATQRLQGRRPPPVSPSHGAERRLVSPGFQARLALASFGNHGRKGSQLQQRSGLVHETGCLQGAGSRRPDTMQTQDLHAAASHVGGPGLGILGVQSRIAVDSSVTQEKNRARQGVLGRLRAGSNHQEGKEQASLGGPSVTVGEHRLASPGFCERLASAGAQNTKATGVWGTSGGPTGAGGKPHQGCEGLASERNTQGMKLTGNAEPTPWIAAGACELGGMTTTGAKSVDAEGRLSSLCSALEKSSASAPACRGTSVRGEDIAFQPFIKQSAGDLLGSCATRYRPDNATTLADELSRQLMLLNERRLDNSKTCETMTIRPGTQESMAAMSGLPMQDVSAALCLPSAPNPPSLASTHIPHRPPLAKLPLTARSSYAMPMNPHSQSLSGPGLSGQAHPQAAARPSTAHAPKEDLSAILSRLEDNKHAGRATTDVALAHETQIAPPGACGGSDDRLGEAHLDEGKVSGPGRSDGDAVVLACAGALGMSVAPQGMTCSEGEMRVSHMPAKALPLALPVPNHMGAVVPPNPGRNLLLPCESVTEHPIIMPDGYDPTCGNCPGIATLPREKLAVWVEEEDPTKRRSLGGDCSPMCSSTPEAPNLLGLPSHLAPHGSCTPALPAQTAPVHVSLHVLSTALQASMHLPSTALQVDTHEEKPHVDSIAERETMPDCAAHPHQDGKQSVDSKATLHNSPAAPMFPSSVQTGETGSTSHALENTPCTRSRAGDATGACPHLASSCCSREEADSPRGADEPFTLLTSAPPSQEIGKPPGNAGDPLGTPIVLLTIAHISDNAIPGKPSSSQVLQRTASGRGVSQHPLTTPMLSPGPLAAAAAPQVPSRLNEDIGGLQPVTPQSAVVSCNLVGDHLGPAGQCGTGGKGSEQVGAVLSVTVSCERPGADITPEGQCTDEGIQEPLHGTPLSVTVSCELPEGAEEATPGMSCASVTQARWRIQPGEASWKGEPVHYAGGRECQDAERSCKGNSLHSARDGRRKDGEGTCRGVSGAPGRDAMREEPVAGPTSTVMSRCTAQVPNLLARAPHCDVPSRQQGVESDAGHKPAPTPTSVLKAEEPPGAHGTDDACASQLSQCNSGKLFVTPQALQSDDSIAQSAELPRVQSGHLSLALLTTPASPPQESRVMGVTEEASRDPTCILGCAEEGEQDIAVGRNHPIAQHTPGETGVARFPSPASLAHVTGDVECYRANLGIAGPLQAGGSEGEAVRDSAPSHPTPTSSNIAPGGVHLPGHAGPRFPAEQREERADGVQRHELGLAHTPPRCSQLSGVNTGPGDCHVEPLTAGAVASSGQVWDAGASRQARDLNDGKCSTSGAQPGTVAATEGASVLLPQTDRPNQVGLLTMHGRQPVYCLNAEGHPVGAELGGLGDELSLGMSTTSCMGDRDEDVDQPGGTSRGRHWAGTSRGCTGVLDLVDSLNRSMCGRPATTPDAAAPVGCDNGNLIQPHVADTLVNEAPPTNQDALTEAGHQQRPHKAAGRGRSNSRRPARAPTPASLLNDILWAVDQPVTAALLMRTDQEEGRGIERDCAADEKCWGGEPLQAGDWDLVVYPGVSLTIIFPGGGQPEQGEVISKTYLASASGLTRHQLVKYIWDFYQEPLEGWEGQHIGTPGTPPDKGLPRSALLCNRTCLQGLFRTSRDRTATTYSLRLGI